MPKRCLVGGCSAGQGDGVSLHKWPKQDKQAKSWTAFLKNTRVLVGSWQPSKESVICSQHFTPDSFAVNEVARSCGFGYK